MAVERQPLDSNAYSSSVRKTLPVGVTSISNFTLPVGTSRVQLSADTTVRSRIHIKAAPGNSNNVFVGTSSVTNNPTPVAQVDTFTIGGTLEAGDEYIVTLNDTAYTYTVVGDEVNLDGIVTALVAQFDSEMDADDVAVAKTSGTTFTLTSQTAGTAFTAVASVGEQGGTADNTLTSETTTPNVAVDDNTEGYILDAGEEIVINCADPTSIYVIGDAASQKVHVLME